MSRERSELGLFPRPNVLGGDARKIALLVCYTAGLNETEALSRLVAHAVLCLEHIRRLMSFKCCDVREMWHAFAGPTRMWLC